MAKIKYTKNELKKQKDSFKRFKRYLPTLELKKQQLQAVIHRTRAAYREIERMADNRRQEIMAWVALFGEDVGFTELLKLEKVETGTSNIAGVDIPVFIRTHFKLTDYDIFTVPLWVDKAIDRVKDLIAARSKMDILQKQIDLLQEELTITTQRVNLFDKVKIPESKENIRVIRIFLGDEQTAGVVRGKTAKRKLQVEAQSI